MKSLHKLLVLMLVLAYTGQGLLASAVHCEMPMSSDAAAGTANMAAMNHTGQSMQAMADEAAGSSSDGSCCDTNLCAMSYCQSAAALPLDLLASSRGYHEVFSHLAGPAAPTRPNDSLYRPPISR